MKTSSSSRAYVPFNWTFGLVIVLIIDQDSVLALKHERQALIAADTDRPVTFEFSGQRVKFPSWGIHVSRLHRVVKGKQPEAQFAGVLRLYSRLRSGAEEPLHAPVPEALNHSYSVALHNTVVKP
jgi:hypothetical protein